MIGMVSMYELMSIKHKYLNFQQRSLHQLKFSKVTIIPNPRVSIRTPLRPLKEYVSMVKGEILKHYNIMVKQMSQKKTFI